MKLTRIAAAGLAVACVGVLTRLATSQINPTTTITISGSVRDTAGLPLANAMIRPHTHGDLNYDGRVDLRDVALFQETFLAPSVAQITSWPQMVTQLRGPIFNIDDPCTW